VGGVCEESKKEKMEKKRQSSLSFPRMSTGKNAWAKRVGAAKRKKKWEEIRSFKNGGEEGRSL